MTVKLRVAGLVVAAGLLAACSGIKSYPDASPKNLVVRPELSKVRAALHIHRVKADCSTEYQGTVQLDRPTVQVGIPPERLSYLVLEFDSSSFLGGRSTTSVGTLLRPRSGYAYEAEARYRDSIYSVVIREIDSRRASSREIPRRDLSSCGR